MSDAAHDQSRAPARACTHDAVAVHDGKPCLTTDLIQLPLHTCVFHVNDDGFRKQSVGKNQPQRHSAAEPQQFLFNAKAQRRKVTPRR